ncbi:MAG: hypothetical protein PWP46_204 [Fusobacteriaceae bacterium]|jgi:hypothetical protein|nr:hypothetical protein [Fusobacteriales bacterium]MDN5303325.1 hypothetical protein [Fusobacteriaceae bacterium]
MKIYKNKEISRESKEKIIKKIRKFKKVFKREIIEIKG